MNKERENIEFFKREDFTKCTNSKMAFGGPEAGWAAQIANKLLNQVLGPKVYGSHLELHGGGKSWRFCEEREFYPEHTHEAFLFNVREIVKECEHDLIVYKHKAGNHPVTDGECLKCNKKLIAKWTVADE